MAEEDVIAVLSAKDEGMCQMAPKGVNALAPFHGAHELH
jgi:hypothetical protein